MNGEGSSLRYSSDIKSHAVTYEVSVDAKTRKILETTGRARTPLSGAGFELRSTERRVQAVRRSPFGLFSATDSSTA